MMHTYYSLLGGGMRALIGGELLLYAYHLPLLIITL
jgi:hypothetical protein